MPTFDFTSPEGKSYTIDGPQGATQEQAFAMLQQHLGATQSTINPAADFAKSIPGGMLSGLTGALSGPVIPESPVPQPDEIMGGHAPDVANFVQQHITGELPKPQGRAGRMGAAMGEALGNPLSYVGPGSLPLKIGGAALAGLGSEAAGQAAEGTPFETPARLVGGLAGGVAGAKALGPAVETAAAPTVRELKVAADKGYNAARNSGVEVNPQKLAGQASQWQQELTTGSQYGFTGGPEGTAPKTLAVLDKLQTPGGATVTASNLDTLRRQINNIAGDTKDFKPTSDAKAAMVLKKLYGDYLENTPSDHIVAGNASDFSAPIKEANANYAAASRAGNVEQKVANAQTNYEGSIAARLDNQVKSQLRPILKNPKAQRGYTSDEVSAIADVNRGTPVSRTLSELGRGGAGVVPAIAHIAIGLPTAIATGGASLIPQAALAAGLYGARKGAERMTLAQAQALSEMLAKRSPLYQQRAAALTPTDLSANKAALIRGILAGAIR